MNRASEWVQGRNRVNEPDSESVSEGVSGMWSSLFFVGQEGGGAFEQCYVVSTGQVN